MKKIVELLIDWDNVDFDDLGVEVMSLVDKPAIGIDFLAFSEEQIVDNTGFEKFDKFFNDNIDLFKKPGGGPAGDGGVDHAEQMKLLKEKGVNTEFPFGYCYQVAQFLFYAMGGYNGPYDLKCIKKMQYKVEGVDFASTHWYIQHSESGRIVDLTASQFDSILDINEWYPEGRPANLGFPYYNVGDDRVEFDNTVPSFQTLKLYSKWREDHEQVPALEKYYEASKYEEMRKDFAEQEFVLPEAGESEEEFIGRCIPVLRAEGYPEEQAIAICYSYWEDKFEDCACEDFDLEDACWPGYEAIGMKNKNGKLVPNCVPIENSKFSYNDYPESIKNAAARGIKLNEAQGNKCGTLVGKQRAQQLAKGEMISAETIKRMYSYLSRAGAYYKPSDTEACGTISYLLWGGPAALEWSERKLEQIDKERVTQAMLEAAEELGEEHDVTQTVYMSTDQFNETVAGVVDAVKALDILGRRNADEEAKIVYKYEGPSPQRQFCKAMVRLSRTKVFTRQEINEMSRRGVNSAFNSPIRGGNYDIFRFAGGANCRHHWSEYKMFKDNQTGQTILIQTGGQTETPADRPNSGFVNATQKAKADQWYSWNFSAIDEEQRIVVGPAMTPNSLIERRDAQGNQYYVYFSKETIREIAEKFFKKNYTNNTDVDHDDNVVQSNTLLESWIKEDEEKDKSSLYGYESTPIGSWFLSYKINDDETWAKIKSGELKGYSIAGNFLEIEK